MKCDPGFLPIRPTPGDHSSRSGTVPFRNQSLCQGLGLAGIRPLRKLTPQRMQLRKSRSIAHSFFCVFSDLLDRRVNIRHEAGDCNTRQEPVSTLNKKRKTEKICFLSAGLTARNLRDSWEGLHPVLRFGILAGFSPPWNPKISRTPFGPDCVEETIFLRMPKFYNSVSVREFFGRIPSPDTALDRCEADRKNRRAGPPSEADTNRFPTPLGSCRITSLFSHPLCEFGKRPFLSLITEMFVGRVSAGGKGILPR